jgi:hypothetical protein
MPKWTKIRKLPVTIEIRDVEGDFEEITTIEGNKLMVDRTNVIARGTEGELYPIKRNLLKKNYEEVNK